MSAYKYQPLQTGYIRLIELLPGSRDKPLRCNLMHVVIVPERSYVALSYVWESDEKPCILHTQAGTIAITASLDSALRRVRWEELPCPLIWADAVCIDQDNNAEKSRQVRMMHQIYSNATYVAAYLGKPDKKSCKFIGLTLRVLPFMKKNPVHHWETFPWNIGRDLQALALFYANPYFHRAWIIQECAAAQRVTFLCGPFSIDARPLAFVTNEILRHKETTVPNITRYISSLKVDGASAIRASIRFPRIIAGCGQPRTGLLQLIYHYEGKEATRDCDQLFSLLSLACDADSASFDANYDEPFEDVSVRYAEGFVAQGRCFELLGHAGGARNSSVYQIPSWIPDWSGPGALDSANSSGLVHGSPYHTAGPTRALAVVDRSRKQLTLRGRLLAVVTDVVDYDRELGLRAFLKLALHSDGPELQGRYLTQCEHLLISSCKATKEDITDIVWRTLIADRDNKGRELNSNTIKAMRSSYQSFRRSTRNPNCSEASSQPDIPEQNISQKSPPRASQSANSLDPSFAYFQEAFNRLGKDYRFAVTDRGHACLVPMETKPGDIVCVFHGGPVPYILRAKTGDDGKVHQYIGRCYVHGVMDGEAFDDQNLTDTDIILH